MWTYHIWDTSTEKCSEKQRREMNPGWQLIVLSLKNVASSAQGGNNNVVVWYWWCHMENVKGLSSGWSELRDVQCCIFPCTMSVLGCKTS